MSDDPLATKVMAALESALEPLVALRIMEYARCGGPAPYDLERARETGTELAEKGDRLMFPMEYRRGGECRQLLGRLADALAVAAFCCPDGASFGRLVCTREGVTVSAP